MNELELLADDIIWRDANGSDRYDMLRAAILKLATEEGHLEEREPVPVEPLAVPADDEIGEEA